MADGPKSSAGRNVKKCGNYKTANRREKNKASRIFKHLMKCDGKNLTSTTAPMPGITIHDKPAITAIKALVGYLTPIRRAKLQTVGIL